MAKKAISGVTYYKLEKRYDGDVTKDCGLTGSELDNNFHFLRGADLKNVFIDTDSGSSTYGSLIFEKFNGETIVVENFHDYISWVYDENWTPASLSGSTYDTETGVLTLVIDGDEYEISGFLRKEDFGVYTNGAIFGSGLVCSPIRLAGAEKTGVFAPVDKFVDYAIGNYLNGATIDTTKRYLTREPASKTGLLYSKDDIAKIAEILNKEGNGWRIATFEDWAEMLNALECEPENRTHGTLEGGYFGDEAGFAVKDPSWEESTCGNNTLNILPTDDDEPDVLYAHFWAPSDENLYEKIFKGGEGKVGTGIEPSKWDKKSIRLVNDSECPFTLILEGVEYKPVYPSASGIAWADINLSLTSLLYEGSGEMVDNTEWKYFVNEYDEVLGRWVKSELKENYSVVIGSYSGRSNEEIINQDGKIVFKYDQYTTDAKEYTDKKIAEVNERIDGVEENLSSVENRVTAAEEAIEQNAENIERLQENLGETNERVSALEEGLEDTNSRVSELESGLTETNERVSELESGLAETNEHVSALEEDLEETKGRVSTLESGLTETNEKVEENKAAISAETQERKEDTQAIRDEIDELAEDIDSALTAIIMDISANTADIEDLYEKVGEGGYITRDIEIVREGQVIAVIPSGTTTTEAFEIIAEVIGAGGEGKVKDILVNDNSIFNEETGIAQLNIVPKDNEVLSVEMSGNTVTVGLLGIKNEIINLS